MKADKLVMGLGVLTIIALAFLIVTQAGVIGVSKAQLEQDARQQQQISADWQAAFDADENLGALLFYDEDKKDYTYSVYSTRDGVSFGYFFDEGGKYPYIEEGVQGFVYEDKGIAFLSLNEDHVCRIIVNTGKENEELFPVNPLKPFAVVVPLDCGQISMYDSMNNLVKQYDSFRG